MRNLSALLKIPIASEPRLVTICRRRLYRQNLLLFYCCALILGTIAAGATAEDSYNHQPQSAVSYQQGSDILWSYQFAKNLGVPYFHPVTTTSGQVLTDFAPADHPWHRGIWFSWKYLSGVNYWEWIDRKTPVLEGQTQTIEEEVVKKVAAGLSITTKLVYSHQNKIVLNELREITIESPRRDGSYTIDWRTTFTAAEHEVVFDRTSPIKHSWGGYSGLSYRASSQLKGHQVLNSAGQKGKQCHGQPAKWMDFSGTLPSGEHAGVAMFDHPENLRYPNAWYLSIGEMGYFNPALLFHEPLSLPAKQSFKLRYRILIHPGQRDALALENEYQAFVR